MTPPPFPFNSCCCCCCHPSCHTATPCIVLHTALLLLLFPLLPESPRYLMVKGQRDAAEKVLERIAKVNGKLLPAGRLVSYFQLQGNLGAPY